MSKSDAVFCKQDGVTGDTKRGVDHRKRMENVWNDLALGGVM